jgi:uncharacterized repeat protein (TIGR04138 family)
MAGLARAIEKRRGDPRSGPVAHVSAAELLDALSEHARATFGAKAKSTLNSWGVHRCEDFGEIVFNMIDADMLRKRPEDKKEDFHGGYDFDTAFGP